MYRTAMVLERRVVQLAEEVHLIGVDEVQAAIVAFLSKCRMGVEQGVRSCLVVDIVRRVVADVVVSFLDSCLLVIDLPIRDQLFLRILQFQQLCFHLSDLVDVVLLLVYFASVALVLKRRLRASVAARSRHLVQLEIFCLLRWA